MEWAEFLNDHELNSIADYHGPPDGEYLLGKVAHDVRECLTTYTGCLGIIATLNDSIPATTLDCYNKWNAIIEGWLAEINHLVEQRGKYSASSPEWARLIAGIGNIVEAAPAFSTEMTALVMPSDATAKQVIQIIVRQAAKLNLLWHDIQAQEYKRLWTTLRYGDLVESN